MRCHASLTSLVALLFLALPVAAEKRAFIIGNSAYEELTPLQNTISDAAAYAETFGALGYEVAFHTDLGLDDMGDQMDAFLASISPGDEVAFVFSGHGWSDGVSNYLIPTDAPQSGVDRKLKRETVALRNGFDGILDEIEASGAGLVLAVIDACRNNPFTPPKGTKSSARSRGLARVTAATGTFVVFSAGEGQEALDRLPSDGADQTLSVFSRNFIPRLREGVYLEDAISEAQLETAAMARKYGGHQQHPAYYDQTLGKTCLAGDCTAPVDVALPVVPAQCQAIYDQTRSPASCETIKPFVDQCSLHPKFNQVLAEYTSCLSDRLNNALAKAADEEQTRKDQTTSQAEAKPKATETPGQWYRRGENFYYGRGVEKSFEEAVKWYRKAADSGYVAAQRDLGSMYDFGRGVAQDHFEAAIWYRKAANQGDPLAQAALGFLYAEGQGVARDPSEALRLFRASAEAGNANGQYQLARSYADGIGQPQDLTQAATWYKKAADQGDGDGQYAYGRHYYLGLGVAQDYDIARDWFRKAADKKVVEAELALGIIHESGHGVPQDMSEAAKWYGKAAEQGSASAQQALGRLYKNGQGVTKDLGKAVELYEKSADQGYADAIYSLAILYETGEGVTKDAKKAAEMYFESTKRGNLLLLETTTSQWDRATLRDLQRLLKEAGHYSGSIDGSMGPGTKRALQALADAG